MDTFPTSMICKHFAFPAGCQRSIIKLLPIITKDVCPGTDDGGAQPWMHNLNASTENCALFQQGDETDTGSDSYDSDSDDDDSYRAGCSADSDEEEQSIITRMNLHSPDFEQDTRPWNDQVD